MYGEKKSLWGCAIALGCWVLAAACAHGDTQKQEPEAPSPAASGQAAQGESQEASSSDIQHTGEAKMETPETFEIAGEAALKPNDPILLLWRPMSAGNPAVPRGPYRRGPVLKAIPSPFSDDKGDVSSQSIHEAMSQVDEAKGFQHILGRSMDYVKGAVDEETSYQFPLELPPDDGHKRLNYYGNYVFQTTKGEALMVLDVVIPAQ